MNIITHLLFLAFFLFSLTASFAQEELRGKIVDFTTFEPIESASIYVMNTTVGTVSNVDGKFSLNVPTKYANDTLVISSIGFKSFKSLVSEFVNDEDIFLEEDIASLDEILLVAETRPKTGNDIMLRAIEELEDNMPEMGYIQKGFLRHKEKNKKEYKWLIESAITLYDSNYGSDASETLKINVDENRKSYDLRDVDSLFAYATYLKYNTRDNKKLRSKNLIRDTIKTASLVKAIKWNDSRLNGLDNLFKGKLNLARDAKSPRGLFGPDMLDKHQFRLDTVLVDNDRKIYKIEIAGGKEFVGLNTPTVFNEGFHAKGWVYIYWDNYAIKKIEYELVAASEAQKRRSKSLFDTQINHKLVLTYMEYQDKMYPKYIYYETPKLVNIGDRSSDKAKTEAEPGFDKDEQFYYTIQEIVFTEILQDPELVAQELDKEWSSDIFSVRPYNQEFWRNYNVLLESEEEEKLIYDLSKRASLFKQ